MPAGMVGTKGDEKKAILKKDGIFWAEVRPCCSPFN